MFKIKDCGVFKAVYRLTVYQFEGGEEKRLGRFDVIAPDDMPMDDLRRAAVRLIGERGEKGKTRVQIVRLTRAAAEITKD